MWGVNKANAASWIAVAVALTGALAYTAANRDGLTAHVPHPSKPNTSSPVQPPKNSPLTVELSFQLSGDTSLLETTYTFKATNFGDQSLTITSVGRSGAGLQLLHASANPATVPPHGSTTVTTTYRVIDCARVTRSPWPLPVTFTSAGNQSTQLLELGSTSPDTPWQTAAADVVCHPQAAAP